MMYQDVRDCRSCSRHFSRRIAGCAMAGATQKTDERTSRLICHLTEIALMLWLEGQAAIERLADAFESHLDTSRLLSILGDTA